MVEFRPLSVNGPKEVRVIDVFLHPGYLVRMKEWPRESERSICPVVFKRWFRPKQENPVAANVVTSPALFKEQMSSSFNVA